MQKPDRKIPFFGARKIARQALDDLDAALRDRDNALLRLREIGGLSFLELKDRQSALTSEIEAQQAELLKLKGAVAAARSIIVETDEVALLQESGMYAYAHPLEDVVAYQKRLEELETSKRSMVKNGAAIEATSTWTVNGSEAKGRSMVSDISKLMLRAFNAEADHLVRTMKPYKLANSLDRLTKVASTIAKLGRSMQIRISDSYFAVRRKELELTSDYLQKLAEQKEVERAERERLKDERKAQQELERERSRLEKERQHYQNAADALLASGDSQAAQRMQEKLGEIEKAIADVDYRAANERAGYVYVISNIGSFGDDMVKIGMTRRLDPTERIRELSDASVPFNYDVHAVFFSDDAVEIESSMHRRFAINRVNLVNLRREFFRITPHQAKEALAELAGELLAFHEVPEAIEYRQSQDKRNSAS